VSALFHQQAERSGLLRGLRKRTVPLVGIALLGTLAGGTAHSSKTSRPGDGRGTQAKKKYSTSVRKETADPTRSPAVARGRRVRRRGGAGERGVPVEGSRRITRLASRRHRTTQECPTAGTCIRTARTARWTPGGRRSEALAVPRSRPETPFVSRSLTLAFA